MMDPTSFILAFLLYEKGNGYSLLNIKDIFVSASVRTFFFFEAVTMQVQNINFIKTVHKGLPHTSEGRIVKIAAYIGQYLLYEPFGPRTFLRTNQGNEFEHFEKPWVSKEDIAKLRNTWNQYEKSIERTTEKGFKWKNNP